MIHCSAFVKRETTSASTLMLFKKKGKKEIKEEKNKTLMNPVSSWRLG